MHVITTKPLKSKKLPRKRYPLREHDEGLPPEESRSSQPVCYSLLVELSKEIEDKESCSHLWSFSNKLFKVVSDMFYLGEREDLSIEEFNAKREELGREGYSLISFLEPIPSGKAKV